MSAKPKSGANGQVYWGSEAMSADAEVARVRNWRLTKSSDNKGFSDSESVNQMQRVGGIIDGTGSFEVYLPGGVPTLEFEEGDIVTIQLDWDGDTGYYYGGEVIIDSIEYEVDVEGAELEGAVVSFSQDGALVQSQH